MQKEKNTVQTMGMMAAVSPFISQTSASRVAMLAHHLVQAPTPICPDIPKALTGYEQTLPTFDVRMPTNGVVISVHHKMKMGFGKHAVGENPATTIIFQCQETGKYDTLTINTYHSRHRTYGSKNTIMPIVKTIRPGMHIPKGTLFAHGPSVKPGGIFSNSLTVNIANISLPGTIEDGYIISKSLAKRFSLTEVSSTVGQFGRKMFPLNIYGTDTEFKAYPDIGDTIREDGLVFAFREWSDIFTPLEMTNKALREVDSVHDVCVYGNPGAVVFDIIAETGIGESKTKVHTPQVMAAQSMRYIDKISDYYKGILEEYDKLSRNKNLVFTPRLTQLVTRAYGDKPNAFRAAGSIIRRVYKGVPLEEYRIEIKAARTKPIAEGSKITAFAGNTNSYL